MKITFAKSIQLLELGYRDSRVDDDGDQDDLYGELTPVLSLQEKKLVLERNGPRVARISVFEVSDYFVSSLFPLYMCIPSDLPSADQYIVQEQLGWIL